MDAGVIAAIVAGVVALVSLAFNLRSESRQRSERDAHERRLAEEQRSHEALLADAQRRHETELERIRLEHARRLASVDPDPHRALHHDLVMTLDELAKVMGEINHYKYLQQLSRRDKEDAKITGAAYEARYYEIVEEMKPFESRYAEIHAEYGKLFARMEATCDEAVIQAARSLYDVAHEVRPGKSGGILNVRDAFIGAAREELAGE